MRLQTIPSSDCRQSQNLAKNSDKPEKRKNRKKVATLSQTRTHKSERRKPPPEKRRSRRDPKQTGWLQQAHTFIRRRRRIDVLQHFEKINRMENDSRNVKIEMKRKSKDHRKEWKEREASKSENSRRSGVSNKVHRFVTCHSEADLSL